MADVFISYRNTDERRAFVARMATILRAYGITVWWDNGLDAGDRYAEKIVEEIDRAQLVMPFWCELSVESQWVLDEAGLGSDKLLPVRLQVVRPPPQFEPIHAARLEGWDGSILDPAIDDFVREVLSRLGRKPVALPADTRRELAALPKLPPLPTPGRTDEAPPRTPWRWLVGGAVAVLAAFLVVWLAGGFDADEAARESLSISGVVDAVQGVEQPLDITVRNLAADGALSGGELELRPVDDAIELLGPRRLGFGPTEGDVRLPSAADPPVRVLPRRVGTSAIEVTATTRLGNRFTGTIEVHTAERVLLRDGDVTGVFRTRLNNLHGRMTLKQVSLRDRHFGGTIEWSDGTTWQIEDDNGFWDGRVFRFEATAGELRYALQLGNYCVLDFEGSRWYVVNAAVRATRDGEDEPLPFVAVPTEERCPIFEPVFADPPPGAGSFQAVAEMQPRNR